MTKKYNHGVLFYHEHSGLKDIYQGLGEVTKSLSSMCKHFSIQLSENEGDIKGYCQSIKNGQYGDDIDVLFILGGDGTVNELINGVMENDLDLPIGIIPGGTFNDFTKTLNLNPNHTLASQQLLSSHIQTYDVIKINDMFALNFVGLGLIVQNAENVQDGSKDIFGKLSYIGSTVKTLMDPSKFDFTLSIDGQEKSGNTSMILIANGPNIGGSRIPLTDLSPQDGQLNTFIFDDQSFSILNDIFKKRDSMNWNEITQGIDHISGKQIKLTTEPNMKIDIDGEIALETPINVEVLPNAQEVVDKLNEHYDVYIATAAMDVPTSFHDKYEWLLEHFPFLDPQHFVFCGRKNIINADYLIDDNPRQLAIFEGESIMYTAVHNMNHQEYKRVNGWKDVEALFLNDK